MASIAIVIEQIKQHPSRLLEHLPIRAMCVEMGLDWRDRCLDPATTAALFIRQIIHGNCSCAQVRHLSDRTFGAQAYCAARQRLPRELIQRLSRRLCDAVRRARQDESQDLFFTHRVFVVDGSTFSMPDTPELQAEFGQSGAQKKGCGFPAAHLLAMFDLNTGMLIEATTGPLRTHDLALIREMHPHLQEGDVLMGDTAFGSYAHFAQLLQAKLHGLMPPHQQRIIDFTPNRPFVRIGQETEDSTGLPRSRWIRSLGDQDQLVEWFKSANCPAYMTKEQYAALAESMIVREIRRRVKHPGTGEWVELTIVTTLLDETMYPAMTLVELRLRRWQVEINLRHLKTTMGMEVLKCKTVEGVLKELAVFGLVYNLVRMLMLEAAARQKTQPDRISFSDVLGWIRVARPDDPMPRFGTNAVRPDRIEPRALKRRMKPYDLMTRPRHEMREALKKQGKGA